jgi:hypothetical protein
MLSKWERCRDVAAGQDAVHDAGEKYLPKLKAQEPDDYKSYKKRATFYNATWRTIAGLAGMVFRKPPRVEVPESARELLKDVNAAGQPFQMLLQSVTEETLKLGRVAVLVDYPEAPKGLTLADARLLKLRPVMQTYTAFSLINWRMGTVNNEWVLVQAVLEEGEWVPDDEFTGKEEKRWRVLDLVDAPADADGPAGKRYRQRVFKLDGSQATGKNAAKKFSQVGKDIYPKMGNKPLGHIPLVIMGTDDISKDVDEPPLIDLVDLNLSHYRTSADLEHGCHFTACPTLFLAGFKPERDAAGNAKKVYVGSETAIVASDPEAKAEYVEFSGSGLNALEKNLDRKEQQMAVLGARMLEPQKKAPESSDSRAINRKGEESALSSVAQTLSLGMTLALKWFCEWADADPKPALVELNREFYAQPMSPQMLTALLSGWQQGAPGLSDQGLFAQLKAGEIVAHDADLEDEQARIADRQRQLAEDQARAQAEFFAQQGGLPGGEPGGQGGAAA